MRISESLGMSAKKYVDEVSMQEHILRVAMLSHPPPMGVSEQLAYLIAATLKAPNPKPYMPIETRLNIDDPTLTETPTEINRKVSSILDSFVHMAGLNNGK